MTLLKYDTLFEQKVKDGTRLKLVEPNLGQMTIFVKFMTGKTVALNVEGNFKLDRVKSLIAIKEEIRSKHQHFIFEGQFFSSFAFAKHNLEMFEFCKDNKSTEEKCKETTLSHSLSDLILNSLS